MKRIFLLIILLFMFGCASLANIRSTIGVPVNVSAETNLDVNASVGVQITGEADGIYLFDVWCVQCPNEYVAGIFGGNYSTLKAAATYDAMDGTGADLIINPQYFLKRESNPIFTTVHVTVTGRIGIIENIK